MTSQVSPKILTVGVFDYFHYGHLRLFQKIKSLYPNSWLTVAVQEDTWIKKFKPEAIIFYNTDVRCRIISSLRPVDEVITYMSVDGIVKKTNFDILVLGEDQNHAGFVRAIEFCRKSFRDVLRLERTPDISSSSIKKSLEFKKP